MCFGCTLRRDSSGGLGAPLCRCCALELRSLALSHSVGFDLAFLLAWKAVAVLLEFAASSVSPACQGVCAMDGAGTRAGTGMRVTRARIGNQIFHDVALKPARDIVAAASVGAKRLLLRAKARSNEYFSVDDNLPSASVPTLNPTDIPKIAEAPSEEQSFQDNELEKQSYEDEGVHEEFIEDDEVQDPFSVDYYLPSAPNLTTNRMNLPRVPETLSMDQLLFLRNNARENPDCLEEKMSILFFSKEENSWVAESLVRTNQVCDIRQFMEAARPMNECSSCIFPAVKNRAQGSGVFWQGT